jgi:hypothetical protein
LDFSLYFYLIVVVVVVFIDSDGDDEGENTVKKPETINFVVMFKKNNKPQVNFLKDFFLFLKYLIYILVS